MPLGGKSSRADPYRERSFAAAQGPVRRPSVARRTRRREARSGSLPSVLFPRDARCTGQQFDRLLPWNFSPVEFP